MSETQNNEIRQVVEALAQTLTDALADADKFDRGNASAGTRVRKALMEVHKGTKAARAQVSQISNDRKND